MNLMKVNLACGDVFVDAPDWLNLDFAPVSDAVKKANLLKRLPVPDNSAEVVYASHFFEHIPRESIASFLQECFRIIVPGGSIRLVLPDFEEMASTYLSYRIAGDHEKADFLIVEIIDQAVRRRSGGELGERYRQLRSADGEFNAEIRRFIYSRNGETFGGAADHTQSQMQSISKETNNKAGRILQMARHRFINAWIRACLYLLPDAFLAQNVSLAGIGERHQWLWDFNQVAVTLKAAKFIEVRKLAFNQTEIDGFPYQTLDVSLDGSPRKGKESMYIEARKPL